ncbi:MAG: hypothetical protein K2W92_03015 [Alphaproteobacteria bacterium]|nr:hypothetical protein [Alphaproteobacteria bacterium]
MTTHHTASETHKRLENFTTKDIKDLVQQHGKAIEGDKEFILKEPAVTDANLQAIVYDPHLEIKSIGSQTKSGEMYYDLRSDGKQVRIKVTCHQIK